MRQFGTFADLLTTACGLTTDGTAPVQRLDPSPYADLLPAATSYDYHWFPRSPLRLDSGPRESGLETAMIAVTEARPPGQVQPDADVPVLAQLRLTYTSEEILNRTFPRPLGFAAEHLGWCLDLPAGYATDHRAANAELTAWQKLWVGVHRYSHRTPAHWTGPAKESWRLSITDAPSDPRTLEADLAAIEKSLTPAIVAFQRSYAIPFVAFSRINDDHPEHIRSGSGVASMMYLLAADQPLVAGTGFRSGVSRTPSAERLWNRLRSLVPHRVGEATVAGWRTALHEGTDAEGHGSNGSGDTVYTLSAAVSEHPW